MYGAVGPMDACLEQIDAERISRNAILSARRARFRIEAVAGLSASAPTRCAPECASAAISDRACRLFDRNAFLTDSSFG